MKPTKVKPRAPMITILGEPGTGKTTLAATFPNPVFVRAEDGLINTSVDAFPVVGGYSDLMEQLDWLIKEKHDYRTVVIDSVTALDDIFASEIMKAENKDNLAHCLGGYGAGFQAVAKRHKDVRLKCEAINRKGVAIVYVAHSTTEDVTPPDMESYTRYTLRMRDNAQQNYVDFADVVAFIRLKAFVSEGKAKSQSKRELVCFAHPAQISKNRYGINDPLVIETPEHNPLLEMIK